MKLSKNWEDKVLICHLLSPYEASNPGIMLHLVELLAKRVSWESSNNPGQDYIFAPHKLTVRPYSWRQHLHTHWTWRSQASAFIEPSPLWARVFSTRKFFVCYQKRSIKTNTATNLWMDNVVLPVRYAILIVLQSCGSNQPVSDLT